MSDSSFKLTNPPIVEAVLDLECDLPPGQLIADLEAPARDCFCDLYPKFKTISLHEHQFQATPNEPSQVSSKHAVHGFQFLQEDESQLVQVRSQGFSFNRLAPYTSFDDYLPEIERTWRLYMQLARPVQVRMIRLRNINRILLPLTEGLVDLDDYLQIAPRLPDEDNMKFSSFLNQYVALETDTGLQANTVLASQAVQENNLPVIFDNGVISGSRGDPEDWPWIASTIDALRGLKNRIFRRTLTEPCLNLFQ